MREKIFQNADPLCASTAHLCCCCLISTLVVILCLIDAKFLSLVGILNILIDWKKQRE